WPRGGISAKASREERRPAIYFSIEAGHRAGSSAAVAATRVRADPGVRAGPQAQSAQRDCLEGQGSCGGETACRKGRAHPRDAGDRTRATATSTIAEACRRVPRIDCTYVARRIV